MRGRYVEDVGGEEGRVLVEVDGGGAAEGFEEEGWAEEFACL
jgi:hypothetical protein